MAARVSPGSAPAPSRHSANLVRRTVVDYGVDPYAAEQSRTLADFNDLTLQGAGSPGAMRFGADGYMDHTQSFDDYEPQQAYDWQTGGTGAPLALGPNVAVPSVSGPPPSANTPGNKLKELLGEAGL